MRLVVLVLLLILVTLVWWAQQPQNVWDFDQDIDMVCFVTDESDLSTELYTAGCVTREGQELWFKLQAPV